MIYYNNYIEIIALRILKKNEKVNNSIVTRYIHNEITDTDNSFLFIAIFLYNAIMLNK